MTRLPDWPERLIAYLDARAERAFAWGNDAHDCCSFGAGAVRAMTGADPMDGVPLYASAEEADLILSATPIEALLDARFERRACAFAQRGDVAIADLNGQDTVMIVEGDTIVGPGRRRLARLPRAAMRLAWAV